MKKLLALVLTLALCMGLVSFTHADDLIKVGIINLDPSESGYREANVKDLTETFTEANGYDAKFATAPTADKQLEAAKGFITDGVKYIWFPPLRPPAGTKCSRKRKTTASACSCSTV